MDKIILELVKKHHVKIIDNFRISVIVNHIYQLTDIATEHDIILKEHFIQQFTVQGIFDIRG